MAAFYPSFLTDSVFSPNHPIKNLSFFDEFLPDFDQIYASFEQPPLIHHLGFSVNDESCCLEKKQSRSNDEKEPLVNRKQRSESFASMADCPQNEEQVSQFLAPVDDKKRKIHLGSPSNSANFKEVKQVKWKKQKGSKEEMKDVKTEKKGEEAIEGSEEAPKGYVHVRARRGQATDSHSLAERARREKISQKMKELEALVPGCNKVSGKALMLDEIINYVHSLQNQVEFLSMKLASLDPMVHIFGLNDHETMALGIEDASSSYWGLNDSGRHNTVNQLGFRPNTNRNDNLYSF